MRMRALSFLRAHGYLQYYCERARGHIVYPAAAAVTMQLTMLKPTSAVDLGFVVWSYGLMASFVERRASDFYLTLRTNSKFQAVCCAIMLSLHVLGSTDYQLAAFSDDARNALQGPTLRRVDKVNFRCNT